MRQRAEQWDLPVAEYVELGERYLGFQQPGSKYSFQDAGHGHKRVRIPVCEVEIFCLYSYVQSALVLLETWDIFGPKS